MAITEAFEKGEPTEADLEHAYNKAREGLQIAHEPTWEVQKDIDYITGLAKLFD